ncbi:MAG: FecCD family ABC transporter permease [Tepidibacillus sp.]
MNTPSLYRKSNFKDPKSLRRLKLTVVLTILGIVFLIAGIMLSISVGSMKIHYSTIIDALFSTNPSKEQMVVRNLRLPRAIMGILVGANLAVAGALMQGITRNPLASPQVFGINAGASLVVVASMILFPSVPPSSLVYLAFFGAALGGIVVYMMASSEGGISPVKLALAGMAVHLFLTAITEGIIVMFETTTESVLYWMAGAIGGKDWTHVKIVIPWTMAGLILSFILARSITILSLGEDVARGLGQKNEWIRIWTAILVIVLAGSSVAVAGPIGFIGLIIPHIVRGLIGVDYQLVIPLSALFGATLLVYADIISRFISYPFESPVGIVTALIGSPFFLYLARKGGKDK